MVRPKAADTNQPPIFSSLAGDPDFAEILPFFIDELPSKIAELSELGDRNDFESIRREAHKLKGSAGGYGFQGLTALASQLEESCKNAPRNEAAILQILDELLDHLQRVKI